MKVRRKNQASSIPRWCVGLARSLGSKAMAGKSSACGVKCDLTQRRKGTDQRADDSLKTNAKGLLTAAHGVENAMKSSGNAKKSTGETNIFIYSIILLVRVIGRRGVRVDDRRDARAWKEGICGVAKHWEERRRFSYLVPLGTTRRLSVALGWRRGSVARCVCLRPGWQAMGNEDSSGVGRSVSKSGG